jgi:hypothetical protein
MHNFTLFFLSFLTVLFSNPVSTDNSVQNQSVSPQIMDSDLIITEIMYNPSGSDTKWEWIEIYNSGTTTIDLSGYVLDDASGPQLSDANIDTGSLAPQKSAIFYDANDVTAEQFKDVWGNVNLIAVSNWSALGNGSGDSIGIWDSYANYDNDHQIQANTIERLTYKNNEEGWPNGNNGGPSIYLTDLSLDNTVGSNWALSLDGSETPLNVNYISTAAHGNSGSDVGSPGNVTFEDTTPPVVECPETVEINHDEGLCSSEIPLLEPSATDDVSTEFIVEGIRSDGLDLLEPFPVGNTTITWTVTDEAGNTSVPCDQLLIVIEDELPTAIAQDITVELNENGKATIDPQDLDNVDTPSFDNCGIAQYLATRTEFDCNDLEAPVSVDFSVLDANGNSSAATNVMVTVIDKLKPELICSENITAVSSNGNPIVLEQIIAPNVVDNCDSETTITAVRSDEADLNDPFPVGTTTIVWQAKDTSGNMTQCSQLVTITLQEDTTPPTFDVDGNTEDFTTELEVGDNYIVGTIMNIVDDNITASQIIGAELVDTSQSGGPFLVTYEVSDGTNTTIITETVLITDSRLAVTNFILVNADTNEDLFEITPDMQISPSSLPSMNLNIRAVTSENAMSVRLELSGTLRNTRLENVAPYALFGDFPVGVYSGREFLSGPYTIMATPFSENRAQGTIGEPLVLNFSIVDTCDTFELIIVDFFDTSTCGGTDGFVLLDTDGGIEPINYSWSHDADFSGNVATDLAAGSYSVTATDNNNCISMVTFEIKDPELPAVDLAPFESITVDSPAVTLNGGVPIGGIFSGEGVIDGVFDPSVGVGIYEITYSYIDAETNCENSATQNIEVTQVELLVTGFTLVNADTNEDIIELTEGLQISLAELPTTNLNIRANTTDDVQSVMLMISGELNRSRKENVAPYALFGDFPAGQYNGKTFTTGFYSITAKPYSENQLGGEMGTPKTIDFEIIGAELAARNDNSVSVFPNPAKEQTILQFENPAEIRTIYLYDVLGRVVATYEGQLVKKDGAYVLDVGSIPAGNYHVKTYDGQGNAHHKQLIVKR